MPEEIVVSSIKKRNSGRSQMFPQYNNEIG